MLRELMAILGATDQEIVTLARSAAASVAAAARVSGRPPDIALHPTSQRL